MNEPRFIELLNLYVDQQLSPQEAAELEAEIQQNPSRHRTYQQYCRMQKACAQLFEHERSAAPASTALSRAMAEADRKIVGFPESATRRSIWPVGFSIGAVAAAACVALIFVLQDNQGGPAAGGEVIATTEKVPVVQASAPAVAVATAATVVVKPAVMVESLTGEFTRVFTMPSLRTESNRAEGLFVSGAPVGGQVWDWTQDVQLKPLRKVTAEEFAFDQRTMTDKPVTTPFSTATAEDVSMEMTAIEFTK